MSVNIQIRVVRVSENCKEAAAKLQKAPGTSAHSDTFMSSSVSSTVASRMKWKLKVESVDDSQYCSTQDMTKRSETEVEAQFKQTGAMGKAGRCFVLAGFILLRYARNWRLAFYQGSESGSTDCYPAQACFQVVKFITFFPSFNHIIYAQWCA